MKLKVKANGVKANSPGFFGSVKAMDQRSQTQSNIQWY